ncbi:MAG: hypothetical protein KatS3mg122_1903 [Caldimonas sp.]|nr:MAG: hypothetical protein KatS3mg122_1903 [Caldimonas sp.]
MPSRAWGWCCANANTGRFCGSAAPHRPQGRSPSTGLKRRVQSGAAISNRLQTEATVCKTLECWLFKRSGACPYCAPLATASSTPSTGRMHGPGPSRRGRDKPRGPSLACPSSKTGACCGCTRKRCRGWPRRGWWRSACASKNALSRPFRIDIEALSPAAGLPVQRWVGHALWLQLQCADGSLRPWHGHVLQAEFAGADGGWARYRLQPGALAEPAASPPRQLRLPRAARPGHRGRRAARPSPGALAGPRAAPLTPPPAVLPVLGKRCAIHRAPAGRRRLVLPLRAPRPPAARRPRST